MNDKILIIKDAFAYLSSQKKNTHWHLKIRSVILQREDTINWQGVEAHVCDTVKDITQ